MKSFMLILILLCSQSLAFAQKPGTKRVDIKYIQPPSIPVSDDVKTYYVEVRNSDGGIELNIENQQNQIVLEGFERAVVLEEADLHIRYDLQRTYYERGEMKKEQRKRKEKDQEVAYNVWFWTTTAKVSIGYEVKDIVNDKFLDSHAGESFKKSKTSDEYTSYSKADDARDEYKNVARGLAAQTFSEEIKKFNTKINDKFGFPKRNFNVPIARGKGKKHDYSDLEGAFEEFSAAIAIYNESGLTDEVIEKVNNCITVWEAAIQEHAPGDKKARISDKNIGHINNNVATAYFVLQDWDNFTKYLDVASAEKGQATHISYARELVADLKNRIEINK